MQGEELVYMIRSIARSTTVYIDKSRLFPGMYCLAPYRTNLGLLRSVSVHFGETPDIPGSVSWKVTDEVLWLINDSSPAR